MKLKYGCNPYQKPAGLYSVDGRNAPFKLLNGSWGFINVLDAVGCWALASELAQLTGKPAAASFKHTSPAGAAVALPWGQLPEPQQRLLNSLCGLGENSGQGVIAYARARNADPQSSFGDFIGYSGVVDGELARMLSKQITDGIVIH